MRLPFAALFGLLMTATWSCQLTGGGRTPALVSRQAVRSQIDRIIARLDPGVHVGLLVQDSRNAEVVFEHNSRQRFVPASTLKVFTAAAALHIMGPAHRFVTDLLVEDAERAGHVARNVYLRGSGDPSLSDADLQELAAALKQQGIGAISGDLVLDDSAFDATLWGHGWMWDDLAEGFSAPVGGLNVLHNEVVARLLPGSRPDAPARLRFSPNSNFISFVSSVVTGQPKSATVVRTQAGPFDSVGLVPGQQVFISGTLPVDGGMVTRRFAVRDGTVFAGTLLREHLHALHIEVAGVVRRGTTPAAAVLVASHASRELSASLIDFMKVSDNHGMECLLKAMGAMVSLSPGSWPAGVSAVRAFLNQQAGLEANVLAISDGSGNSRYSLVSPHNLAALLLYMQKDFSTGPEFIASLPIGGLDGTLMHRMLPASLHGRVRAKTGTMAGVSNLAGYIETDTKDVLTFAIMTEGFTGSPELYRRFQDEVLLTLSHAGAH